LNREHELKNTMSVGCAVLAAVWGLAPLSAAVAATAEPTISDTPVPVKPSPETEEQREPEKQLTFPEGPVPRSPFNPITSPGDPFGLGSFGSGVATGAPVGVAGYGGLAAGVPPGAAGFRVGPTILYPTIAASLAYDDNIFSSNVIKRSSWGTIVSPSLRAELRPRGGHVLGLTYSGDFVNYADSSADNYTNTLLRADGQLIFTSRARLSLDASYIESIDRRGSTDRQVSAEPDKWDSKSGSALFTYGAPGARGRIDVEGGYRDLTYKNNRAVTAPFDHETTYGGGAFYWRFMPKTSLLFQARFTEYDYPSSDQSSTERLLAVGITWEATAQTSGTIRVGQERKEFDAPGLEGFTGLAWEATIRWSPRTYSNVDFTTAQHTSESTGFGDYTLSRVAFAQWTHDWTSRMQSTVRLGLRNDDYRATAPVPENRDDDTTTVGAGLRYQFRRWLRFEGRWDHVRRSSNVPTEEYNRNIFMFTVGATL
jgi:hypothetical protein